jgi:hypothetical protein
MSLAEAEDRKGGKAEPALILIATGSEVGLAMEAREKLNKSGTPTRVVSMPCWEFFDEQSAKYKESVLPAKVKARLAIEAGVSQGWHKYIGDARRHTHRRQIRSLRPRRGCVQGLRVYRRERDQESEKAHFIGKWLPI